MDFEMPSTAATWYDFARKSSLNNNKKKNYSQSNIRNINYDLTPPVRIVGDIGTNQDNTSSLSTTAIIALVASGAIPLPAAIACVLGANIGTKGTIWLAGLLVSDGMPKGDTLRIAMAHTGVNLFMAATLLPFVHRIAQFLGRF